MFTIDPNITDLKIKAEDMEKVFFSMNNHQVATPEMMLEEARSYIMFFREAKGKLSSYIGLHLLQTGRKLFYAHASNPFPEAEMDSIEEEALGFVEGLGAMLDEVDFSEMSSQDKKRWIEEQEIFTRKPEPESMPEEQKGEAPPLETPPLQQVPQTSSPGTEAAPPAQQAPEPWQAPPAQYVQQPPQPQQVPPAAPPQVQQAPSAPYAPPVPPQQAAPQAAPPPVPEMPEPTSQTTFASPDEARDQSVRGADDETETPKAAKSRHDIVRKAIKAGVIKPPKPSIKKEAQAAAGVVSRDREALARLLTSF